ncbi:MAG: putative toxin-antitoxin system toxin component, PIN family [Crocosphaera sp.]
MVSKIVVDTSVFISSLIGVAGPSRKLIRYCLRGDYQPLMGNALFCEYESVSKRSEIIEKTPLNMTEVNQLFKAFMSVCHWINVYYLWRPNLKDEGDNHLIELAIAGNGSYIVTNNIKDFRNSQLLFPHLSIVTPETLLRS